MEALYFPRLSLPASAWVNPALLYFDRLDVIAPEDSPRRLFDDRTHALIGEGLVRPISPYMHRWNERQDERLVAYLLGLARNPPPVRSIERLHFGKIEHTLLGTELVLAGLLMPAEGPWLEGPDWVCAHVMAYLALQLSTHPDLRVPLVTDQEETQRLMSPQQPRPNARIRRIKAVSRLLPVPGIVPIDELVRFKGHHKQELNAFRREVEELITGDALDRGDEGTFERRLEEAVRRREYLEGEIGRAGWGSAVIPVGLAATMAIAPAVEGSPWSAGAGLLGLVVAGAQEARAHARGRRARRSPLVYAALASKKWRPDES